MEMMDTTYLILKSVTQKIYIYGYTLLETRKKIVRIIETLLYFRSRIWNQNWTFMWLDPWTILSITCCRKFLLFRLTISQSQTWTACTTYESSTFQNVITSLRKVYIVYWMDHQSAYFMQSKRKLPVEICWILSTTMRKFPVEICWILYNHKYLISVAVIFWSLNHIYAIICYGEYKISHQFPPIYLYRKYLNSKWITDIRSHLSIFQQFSENINELPSSKPEKSVPRVSKSHTLFMSLNLTSLSMNSGRNVTDATVHVRI